MYNAEKPTLEDLPSSEQLLKSTILACAIAVAVLVTVILPAEYNIDPTGIGAKLGLREMGEIKAQLAREAAEDAAKATNPAIPAKATPTKTAPIIKMEPANGQQSSVMDSLIGLVVTKAHAQETGSAWRNQLSFSLRPGQGVEIKLVMQKGSIAEYEWTVAKGVANYDLHGDGSGQKISYRKGRGVPGDTGKLQAAFTGNHGWFWRNRDKQTITVTLKTRGDYKKLKLPN